MSHRAAGLRMSDRELVTIMVKPAASYVGFARGVNGGPFLGFLAILAILGLTAPSDASAQARPAAPAPGSAPDLKSYDLAGYLGRFGAKAASSGESFESFHDDRYGAIYLALGGGYYWTEHIKTEVEFGGTGEAEVYGLRSFAVNVPGVPPNFPLYSRQHVSSRTLSVAQSYQFFHNTWFHPYVSAGVDVEWERRRTMYPPQSYYPPPVFTPGVPSQPRPPIPIPGRPDEEERNVLTSVFAATGFKAYVARHAFFRSDLKFGGRSDRRSVVVRIGMGVDF